MKILQTKQIGILQTQRK